MGHAASRPKVGHARLHNLVPDVFGHVGVGAFTRKAGVHTDDNVGILIRNSVAEDVPGELGLAVV